MKNKIKTEAEITKVVEEIHAEIKPALYEYYPDSSVLFEKKEEKIKNKSSREKGGGKKPLL